MKEYKFTEQQLNEILSKIGDAPYKVAFPIINLLKQYAKEIPEAPVEEK